VSESEGLRARKQRQTRERIHRAAVALAAELGPDAATVAEIAARADISVRTFFNYYPAKEDAIVGMHEGLPSDAELDDFRAATSDDLIHDILQLLIGVLSPEDDELMHQRRALITEHPYLIQRQWTRLLGVEQRTAEAVSDRMRASGSFDNLSDIDTAARALVVTCSSVLRLSVRNAVELNRYPADVPQRIDVTMHALREVLRTLP
jgi:AcrR family transcriptional regulator